MNNIKEFLKEKEKIKCSVCKLADALYIITIYKKKSYNSEDLSLVENFYLCSLCYNVLFAFRQEKND